MSASESMKILQRIELEVTPLVRQNALREAIDLLRSWIHDERAADARLIVLAEVANLLQVAGRDEEALAAIDDLIALAPDEPIGWSRLAAWHFYCHGAYSANEQTLGAALSAINVAVARAREQGSHLRYCLNERARIAVAMKNWDIVEQTLNEILAIPAGRGVPDIALEDDFLQRVPERTIDCDLLRRYRSACAAQEARRAGQELSSE